MKQLHFIFHNPTFYVFFSISHKLFLTLEAAETDNLYPIFTVF